MSLPVISTFDYVATVPHDPQQRGQPWPVRQRSRRGDENFPDARLVGLTPSLQITDAGLTPNAGWNRGRWLPSVQRGRLTLSAAGRERATVASASFHVDMGLINSLQPGDIVHLVLTGSGGLAISVIRGETLLAAAGAVTAVPLGNDLVARYPEVMEAVEALFREADPTLSDWFGPLPEVPIEIRHEDQRRIRCRANIELGPISCLHGSRHLPRYSWDRRLCRDITSRSRSGNSHDCVCSASGRWRNRDCGMVNGCRPSATLACRSASGETMSAGLDDQRRTNNGGYAGNLAA